MLNSWLEPTLFGFVIGLAGIPIGALIGLCYALELLAQPAEAPIPGSILGLAMVLGTVFVAMLIAVSQSHGASPFEVLEFPRQVRNENLLVPAGLKTDPGAAQVGALVSSRIYRLAGVLAGSDEYC